MQRGLKGEALMRGGLLKHDKNLPWTHREGKYYIPEFTQDGIGGLLASRDFCMYTPLLVDSNATRMRLFWGWPKYSGVALLICPQDGVIITLHPRCDEDVQGAALVQALLSES